MDWQPGKVLKLETERFKLRSLSIADATDTYISWWNDAEVQEGLGGKPRGWGKVQAQRHIAKFNNRNNFHLGIFCKEDELHIGFIAVFLEAAQVAKTNSVIGNKEFWGQGVVLEVRDRVLQFLFEDLETFKVVGQVDARNISSVFNYKAQGFSTEGVLRQQITAADGTRHDQIHFGLLREEWQANE